MKLLNLDTKDRANGEPFRCNILSVPVERVKYIKLLSIELPLCWYSVREHFNEFKFSIYDSFGVKASTHTLNITPGNYTTQSFCDTLQNEINNTVSGTTATVSYDSITTRLTISMTNNYEIEVETTELTRVILGFKDKQKGGVIESHYSYNFNHDLYVYIVINNLQTNYANHPMTFKIPVKQNMNTIQTLSINDWFMQYITLEDTRLYSFNITVYDRYGYVLDNNGCDMSLTLELLEH